MEQLKYLRSVCNSSKFAIISRYLSYLTFLYSLVYKIIMLLAIFFQVSTKSPSLRICNFFFLFQISKRQLIFILLFFSFKIHDTRFLSKLRSIFLLLLLSLFETTSRNLDLRALIVALIKRGTRSFRVTRERRAYESVPWPHSRSVSRARVVRQGSKLHTFGFLLCTSRRMHEIRVRPRVAFLLLPPPSFLFRVSSRLSLRLRPPDIFLLASAALVCPFGKLIS